MNSKLKILFFRLLAIFLLFQASRLLFIGFNQALFCNQEWYKYFILIFHSFKFDLLALCMVNAPFILLSLVPFRFYTEKTFQFILMLVFVIPNTIALVVNLVDVFYYPYTLKRLTWSIFNYLGTQENMSSLGVEFLITYWYAYVLLGILIFLLVKLFLVSRRKFETKPEQLSLQKGTIIFILSLCFLVVYCKGNWLKIKDAIKDVDHPEEAGIVLNSAFTLLSSKMENYKPPQYYNQNQLDSLLPPVHHYQSNEVFRRDNVVIIILESFTREAFKSLNADLEEGNYSGCAPFLDSLLHESLYFTNASANGRKSMDAVPAILSSIPAGQTPFILANQSGRKVESLASHLANKGYETMFFHGSHNATMDFVNYCKWAGIEHYYGLNEYPNPEDFDGTWGIWDEEYLQYMAHELNKYKKPFLATVFTLSSHNPYVVPEKYRGVFDKGTEGIHKTMHYTDNALRNFFKTASKMPWYNNTLFVITADHSITPWHKEYATSARAFSIPLLFYSPTNRLKGKREEAVQHIDILPSVLSYLNYSEPFISAGNNLLDPKAPKFTVNKINQCYQMIQDNYLLLFDGEKTKALYNLTTDHYQKNNLLEKEQTKKMQMEQLLKAWIQKYDPGLYYY